MGKEPWEQRPTAGFLLARVTLPWKARMPCVQWVVWIRGRGLREIGNLLSTG